MYGLSGSFQVDVAGWSGSGACVIATWRQVAKLLLRSGRHPVLILCHLYRYLLGLRVTIMD